MQTAGGAGWSSHSNDSAISSMRSKLMEEKESAKDAGCLVPVGTRSLVVT